MKIQKRIFLFFAAIAVSIASSFAQDVITLKSGKEITGLVYEIGDIDVKYKKIDNPSGPNYTLKKSEITMIKYANGSKDVFNESAPVQSTQYNRNEENTSPQDVIILKKGDNIPALVQEVGTDEVKYKKIDRPNGTTYTLKKSDILVIRYADGSNDTFGNKVPEQLLMQNTGEETFEEMVETAPEYIGGIPALTIYLVHNLKYPKSALKKGIQGQVILRFLVKEKGSISDIQVIKKLQNDCDYEAIQLVQNMPKWIPAKLNGKPVKAYYSLPINFKL